MSDVDELGNEPEGRVPPQNLLAEQSVLGSMMLSKAAVVDVGDVLDPGDYYVPKHEVIHRAILSLVDRGEPHDIISVTDELTRTGKISKAGGFGYVASLTDAMPTAANAGYHAEKVREKAIMRRLVEAGERIVQMGYASEGIAIDLAEKARAELDAAAQNSRRDLRPIGEAFGRVVTDLEEKPSYIETPWREINDYIGGLRPGCLYVVGARPGEGKTIMGLQIATQLALSGPVAFSSLEMSEDELLKRLIAMKAKVHMTPMGTHSLSAEDWEKIAIARSGILALPLFVDDRSGVNITQIKAHARSAQRKGQLRGVVVDYIQLITGGDPRQQRWEIVGEISRQLKILARELQCPVVALAQLNRESVGKQKRAPQIADLRESGSIEQDADVIMLLQRQRDQDDIVTDQLNVFVAKNRHGRTGMRTLLWEGQYARLSSRQWGMPELPIHD